MNGALVLFAIRLLSSIVYYVNFPSRLLSQHAKLSHTPVESDMYRIIVMLYIDSHAQSMF